MRRQHWSSCPVLHHQQQPEHKQQFRPQRTQNIKAFPLLTNIRPAVKRPTSQLACPIVRKEKTFEVTTMSFNIATRSTITYHEIFGQFRWLLLAGLPFSLVTMGSGNLSSYWHSDVQGSSYYTGVTACFRAPVRAHFWGPDSCNLATISVQFCTESCRTLFRAGVSGCKCKAVHCCLHSTK